MQETGFFFILCHEVLRRRQKGESNGLVVKAQYLSGKVEDITASVTISEPDMSTVGQKEVKITYGDFKENFTISVLAKGKTLETLKFMKLPAKTEYYPGEEFNPYGLVIKAVFSDGSTIENVASECTFTFNFTESNVIVCHYLNVECRFAVTVETGEPTLEHKAACFAFAFNEEFDDIESQNITLEQWDSLKYNYNQLDEETKNYLKTVSASTGVGEVSADTANKDALRKCVAKYDETYLAHKNEGFTDYLERNPVAPTPTPTPDPKPNAFGCGGSVVAASALVSVLAFAGISLILIRKYKKSKNNI